MKVLNDSLYLHAFNLLPQFGPARLMRLKAGFEDFHQAFSATKNQLILSGLEEDLAEKFLLFRAGLDLEEESRKLESCGIKLLTADDENFPKLLKEIPKPPPLLYVRGEIFPEELCLAVVGTRSITTYGRLATAQLVEPLIDCGLTVVSGLAFGVDALAQELAVKKNKRTIGVLGGGIDDRSIYPKAHQWLASRILEAGGALVSEYPIGTPNFKQNFVARNRIISGLSSAVLVVECDLESGTLITANHALDQNRQVYAVPGPIYSQQSQGPNNLLKMGAKPVTSAGDIIEDLNLKNLNLQNGAQDLVPETTEEKILLGFLGKEPILLNDLIKKSGLQTSAVTSCMTFLEMKGKVRNLGGQQYVLAR